MIGKGLNLKKVRFTKRGARQQQITFLRTLFPFSLLSISRLHSIYAAGYRPCLSGHCTPQSYVVFAGNANRYFQSLSTNSMRSLNLKTAKSPFLLFFPDNGFLSPLSSLAAFVSYFPQNRDL